MRTIEIAGKQYPVLFDVNVISRVQQRYQTVDALPEKLRDISETVWMLVQIINEAAAYQRIFEGGAVLEEPMTEEKLGMLLTLGDLYEDSGLAQIIIDAFNDGMGGRKNQPAGQGKKNRSGKRKKKRR